MFALKWKQSHSFLAPAPISVLKSYCFKKKDQPFFSSDSLSLNTLASGVGSSGYCCIIRLADNDDDDHCWKAAAFHQVCAFANIMMVMMQSAWRRMLFVCKKVTGRPNVYWAQKNKKIYLCFLNRCLPHGLLFIASARRLCERTNSNVWW